MVCNTPPSEYGRYAPHTIILKTRSDVKVKVTVTWKWNPTLRHPKIYSYTKFGIPTGTSKNIGDMHQTRSGMDGMWLLYASQNSFGGAQKRQMNGQWDYYISPKIPWGNKNPAKACFSHDVAYMIYI